MVLKIIYISQFCMPLSTKMGPIRVDDITDNIIQSLMFNQINHLKRSLWQAHCLGCLVAKVRGNRYPRCDTSP